MGIAARRSHALTANARHQVNTRVGRMLKYLLRLALGVITVPGALNAPVGEVEDTAGLVQHQLVELVGIVEVELVGRREVGVLVRVSDNNRASERRLKQDVNASVPQLSVHGLGLQLRKRRALWKAW